MAKDLYRDLVKELLIADGWTITHDPLLLSFGVRKVYADLGAERIIAAEKGKKKIAVEVKSFVGLSAIEDLEKALGQWRIYKHILKRKDKKRILFFALRSEAFYEIFSDAFGDMIRSEENLNFIVFDPNKKEIVRWLRAKN